MTHSSAEKLANIAIGVAVAGAAYYVLKTPSLRRVAWRLTVIALTGSAPAWLGQEIKQAWSDSGRSIPMKQR
jgi:hypothetical protein